MAITLIIGNQIVDLAVTPATVTLNTYIPGPPGPAGEVGFTLPTNSDIGGNRAISTVSGYAAYADCSDITKPAIGVSTGAVSSGSDVTLQSGSKMTVVGAGWTPDQPIYVSTNGILTQTEPVSGFSQVLGVAHDSETIIIEIQKPIILA